MLNLIQQLQDKVQAVAEDHGHRGFVTLSLDEARAIINACTAAKDEPYHFQEQWGEWTDPHDNPFVAVAVALDAEGRDTTVFWQDSVPTIISAVSIRPNNLAYQYAVAHMVELLESHEGVELCPDHGLWIARVRLD